MSTIQGIGPILKLELQEMHQQIMVALAAYHVDLEKLVSERMAKCIESYDIAADVDAIIHREYESWLKRTIEYVFLEAMREHKFRDKVEQAAKDAIGPILDRQFGKEEK